MTLLLKIAFSGGGHEGMKLVQDLFNRLADTDEDNEILKLRLSHQNVILHAVRASGLNDTQIKEELQKIAILRILET
jgi:hypothetical protein